MQQRRAAARPYTRAVEDMPVPGTPSHTPHHTRINVIVAKLERTWNLGLKLRNETWSPSHSASRSHAEQEKCYSKIKLLYYKASDVLDGLLREFETKAREKQPKDRLPYLRHLLDDALRRTSTPKTNGTPLQRKFEQAAKPSSRSVEKNPSNPSTIFNRPRTSLFCLILLSTSHHSQTCTGASACSAIARVQ